MRRLEDTRFWRGLEKLLRFGLIVTSIIVTLIVVGSVVLRELNMNFLGYEEILVIFAFWLYMLGAAYGSYERSHITADIIIVMMKDGMLKSLLTLIRDALAVIFGIIFFIWVYEMVGWSIEMDTRTPAWRIPVAVGQGSMVVGLLLCNFYHIVYFYRNVQAFIRTHIKKTTAVGSESNDVKEA